VLGLLKKPQNQHHSHTAPVAKSLPVYFICHDTAGHGVVVVLNAFVLIKFSEVNFRKAFKTLRRVQS
jgi:hypothetical protein